jgi:hypothetical protein
MVCAVGDDLWSEEEAAQSLRDSRLLLSTKPPMNTLPGTKYIIQSAEVRDVFTREEAHWSKSGPYKTASGLVVLEIERERLFAS